MADEKQVSHLDGQEKEVRHLDGQEKEVSYLDGQEKEVVHPTDQKRSRYNPFGHAQHGTADEAMRAFEGEDGQPIILDDATNKRLLRRIDLHIMPLMCIVYGLNYLDKTTLSYANVMGLKKSLHLKGDDYQWLGSMFYFGAPPPSQTSGDSY